MDRPRILVYRKTMESKERVLFLCPVCDAELRMIDDRCGKWQWVCPVALEELKTIGSVRMKMRASGHRSVIVYGAKSTR